MHFNLYSNTALLLLSSYSYVTLSQIQFLMDLFAFMTLVFGARLDCFETMGLDAVSKHGDDCTEVKKSIKIPSNVDYEKLKTIFSQDGYLILKLLIKNQVIKLLNR